MERNLSARDSDLVQARNALVLALAELVSCRDTESGAHLLRVQRYCRCLAEESANSPCFAGQIDATFIHMLEISAPLHDIGKVGLPDHILLKPAMTTIGNLQLIKSRPLALLCSIQCPAEAILKLFDLGGGAGHWRRSSSTSPSWAVASAGQFHQKGTFGKRSRVEFSKIQLHYECLGISDHVGITYYPSFQASTPHQAGSCTRL